ncbi:putative protein kinase TKL-CTR1-DRK-2 family [Helianthus annuus]|nr:putative protein kinase TKL-CTR1-DRK-2 family [Helianthus annuus]
MCRNPAWERLYGYSLAETLGKHLVELTIGPKEAAIANTCLDQIFKGAFHGGEFVITNKKGEKFLSFSASTPLRDQNGNIIGMTGISVIPTPFPQISPQPKADVPTYMATSKTDVPSMLRNGFSCPWNGNPPSRSIWHWLYHSDQEHEYILNTMPAKLESKSCFNTNTLSQWSSSFDKVYEIKWEDLLIRECIGRGIANTMSQFKKKKIYICIYFNDFAAYILVGSYGRLYHALWCGSVCSVSPCPSYLDTINYIFISDCNVIVQDVAVKLFHKQEYYSHDLILSFRQEVSVMKRLRHPNILLFMGAVISPHHVCIVTEFLCRGSLFQLLHRRRVRFNLKHRVHMSLDIARGMNYLHCCLPPIIHCDLKSSNLRVDKTWTVKIGDFGLCRPKHGRKEGTGSPPWMAPEVLRSEEADEKSDVYSYGVVLWEMTTEKIPWDGLTSIQVIEAVGFMNQGLHIPNDVDPQWASLIRRCLCSEPDSRPTFQEILDDLKELQKNIPLQLDNNNH